MPPSILDETMNLATWNIREFGRRERLPQSLHYIAEGMGRFEVVAPTEVWRDLLDLLRVMDLLPPFWDFAVSDYGRDRAANKERVARVFDKRVVRFTGLAAEAAPPRKRNQQGRYEPRFTWWRAPYIASFRAGNFDFVVVAVHLRWGSGEAERRVPLKESQDGPATGAGTSAASAATSSSQGHEHPVPRERTVPGGPPPRTEFSRSACGTPGK